MAFRGQKSYANTKNSRMWYTYHTCVKIGVRSPVESVISSAPVEHSTEPNQKPSFFAHGPTPLTEKPLIRQNH